MLYNMKTHRNHGFFFLPSGWWFLLNWTAFCNPTTSRYQSKRTTKNVSFFFLLPVHFLIFCYGSVLLRILVKETILIDIFSLWTFNKSENSYCVKRRQVFLSSFKQLSLLCHQTLYSESWITLLFTWLFFNFFNDF